MTAYIAHSLRPLGASMPRLQQRNQGQQSAEPHHPPDPHPPTPPPAAPPPRPRILAPPRKPPGLVLDLPVPLPDDVLGFPLRPRVTGPVAPKSRRPGRVGASRK